MNLFSGPGAVQDERGRPVIIDSDSRGYLDDDGKLVVKRDNPHPILRTRWVPRDGADVPPVEIVGVQGFSDETVEVVIAPQTFGDPNFTDEWGAPALNRSVPLSVLLEFWEGEEEARATATVTEALRQLERLG